MKYLKNSFIKKYTSSFFFSFFFLTICLSNESLSTENSNLNFQISFFDVVEKKLTLDKSFTPNISKIVQKWFDNKVKINGFSGKLDCELFNYNEVISDISNGKKVDLALEFKLTITGQPLSNKKVIEGKVNSYGTMTGNFSLNDFDELTSSTQFNLIKRFSENLNKKF
jgi:hypothetical protein